MMGLGPPSRVTSSQGGEVQLLDDLGDKSCEMVLGQPFIHRGRQQVIRLAIHKDEAAHGDLLSSVMTAGSISRCDEKSDRLLGIIFRYIT